MNTIPYPAECSNSTLMFLNNPHKATQVYHAARAAPEVRVEIKDLLIDHPDAPKFYPDAAPMDRLSLLIYKYNGRWLVLTGLDIVRKAIADGHSIVAGALISTPSLKKCRIVATGAAETVIPIAPTVARPYDNSASRNPRPASAPRAYDRPSFKRT
jgi:hypothetical protein